VNAKLSQAEDVNVVRWRRVAYIGFTRSAAKNCRIDGKDQREERESISHSAEA